MTDRPRVLALIPARGGSKGLPGKNLLPLAGLPLIGHSLHAAELLESVTRTVVTTDSPEIASAARDLGGDVPFLRPAELARDDTPMAPVLRHALRMVETEEAAEYDYVILLDPTSPARDPAEIDAAVGTLAGEPTWDGVVSVSTPSFHPVWVGVRRDDDGSDRLTRYFDAGSGVTRRQQLDSYLRINGNFYVWRAAFVRRMEVSWLDEGVHGMVEIAEVRAFAIDYAEHLRVLDALVAQGVVTLPWLTRPV